MILEPGKTYLTNDGRKALCLGVTDDGRAAVVIEKRKMIETYGADGTFRISSDREVDEGLHIASLYVAPAGIWAAVDKFGNVVAVNHNKGNFTDAELHGCRVVWLQEDRQ